MKIGIYGGTFNPIHMGHISAARFAVDYLGLDQLCLIPTGIPPHKQLASDAPSPEHRRAMAQLAAEAIGLEVMRYLKQEETVKRIAAETESRAMRALEKIRSILNDDSLEDPECFRRIKAILRILEKRGIGSLRHDW